MQARKVGNDGRLSAAAFTDNRTAIWFGRRFIAVKARFDPSDRGLEQGVLYQDAL
jgi:hypothetical protein